MHHHHSHSTSAELELHELEAGSRATSAVPRFHARQIFQWIYRRGVTDFAAMTDLGRDLRAELATRRATIATPVVVRQERSDDGTTKFLLRLADGKLIESVCIPDTPGADVLHLDPGRLRDEVRLLPHRQDGDRSAT